MKLTRFLGLSIGLAAGYATATASTYDVLTGTVWAKGVSQAGGWYDANKIDPFDGAADDLLCYAASANWKLIPEPTTATLSLVALAALVMRRRRK